MATTRLLIGASSPIGYSYEIRDRGRPCAVLENPTSYCLLYDEIWFLSRQLCPFDWEDLGFVHFVDEDILHGRLPVPEIPEEEQGMIEGWNWSHWENTVDIALRNHREWKCDNHSVPVEIGGMKILPTPGRKENLYIDRFVAAEYEMQLAENTPNSRVSAEADQQVLQMTLSERVLSTKMPRLQTPLISWHPVLHDLRNDSLLKSYRRKITKLDKMEWEELDDRLRELVAEYEEEVLRSVSDRFSRTDFAYSTASFLIGLIPGMGTIAGFADWIRVLATQLQDRHENSWVAFLAKLEGAQSCT